MRTRRHSPLMCSPALLRQKRPEQARCEQDSRGTREPRPSIGLLSLQDVSLPSNDVSKVTSFFVEEARASSPLDQIMQIPGADAQREAQASANPFADPLCCGLIKRPRQLVNQQAEVALVPSGSLGQFPKS